MVDSEVLGAAVAVLVTVPSVDVVDLVEETVPVTVDSAVAVLVFCYHESYSYCSDFPFIGSIDIILISEIRNIITPQFQESVQL